MSRWPSNPIELIIKRVKQFPTTAVIADMGCGEGNLALSVPNPARVHSFDLVAAKPHIVACDIANVPLMSASVDIVIFSLALMGTNYKSFLE